MTRLRCAENHKAEAFRIFLPKPGTQFSFFLDLPDHLSNRLGPQPGFQQPQRQSDLTNILKIVEPPGTGTFSRTDRRSDTVFLALGKLDDSPGLVLLQSEELRRFFC